jgi:hypothetical protein
MAVTILNTLFLAECWREGARFDYTLMLGRLDCFMWSRDLQRIARLIPNKSEFVESVKRGEVPLDEGLDATYRRGPSSACAHTRRFLWLC